MQEGVIAILLQQITASQLREASPAPEPKAKLTKKRKAQG
jgi:hypothetical protein